jgi:hypothetical protein
MKRIFSHIFLPVITLLLPLRFPVGAQTVLEADGAGETYELINNVLAPGYNAVESPDCAHPGFGRHITEAWDTALNQYVFEFHIHVTPDNDRCLNFDRQRMEIKTYASSPANLIGVAGETIVYHWKFRLAPGFQPSPNFTHLHQIKAVGGDESDPIFTLTARKGSPNRMELIHDNSNKVTMANLSLFEGNWVEVTERIKVDHVNGTYSIDIKNIATGATILSYNNNKLMTIRADNDFVRPKWGIYRSLLNSKDLRDEVVRFAGFSILEETVSAMVQPKDHAENLKAYPNPSKGYTEIEYFMNEKGQAKLDICDVNGHVLHTLIDDSLLGKGKYKHSSDLSFLPDGIYFVRLSCENYCDTVKLLITK